MNEFDIDRVIRENDFVARQRVLDLCWNPTQKVVHVSVCDNLDSECDCFKCETSRQSCELDAALMTIERNRGYDPDEEAFEFLMRACPYCGYDHEMVKEWVEDSRYRTVEEFCLKFHDGINEHYNVTPSNLELDCEPDQILMAPNPYQEGFACLK